MANDLNQCNFIGRVGKDPEQRFMASGESVTNFSIAVGWKTKDKDGAEWVNVVTFGKLSEICFEYLRKGSQVFISGRLKNEKYTDANGTEKYTTKIIAEKMQMLGGRQDDQKQSEQRQVQKPVQGYQGGTGAPDDFEDDVPF